MSARATVATARRVLTQLRRDHRTLGLLLGVPVLLLVLLRYVYADQQPVFDRVGGPLLALWARGWAVAGLTSWKIINPMR